MKIKQIPNLISVLRMVCSVALLFTGGLSPAFYSLYVVCGVSDALDGYIARRTNTVSRLGAALDSVADVLFFGSIVIVFLPLLTPSVWVLVWLGGIALLRIVSLGIGWYKYHMLAFLHTYANKAAGFVIFLAPVIYALVGLSVTAIIVCVPAMVSAIEELLINSTSKQLNRDIKGIFMQSGYEV